MIRTVMRIFIIILVAGMVAGGLSFLSQTSLARSLVPEREGHGPPPGLDVDEDGDFSQEGQGYGFLTDGEGSRRRFGDHPHPLPGERDGGEDGGEERAGRAGGEDGFALARALPGLARNAGIIALVVLGVFALRKGFGLLTMRRRSSMVQ